MNSLSLFDLDVQKLESSSCIIEPEPNEP
ncbi:hypothetical protein OOU_Y34scaffold00233g16 [Pyricularia oryzae Y34]|uniref:Uncharacterized protein n=1 Tax=Pyricularia oryzae (strain Y34) TaxID=1143189 RepID=A0AA97P503_PYRO3|nr:hypothetical protein OOU_Y34scaffold00233g16 [Pyricularia oryzae Y34]